MADILLDADRLKVLFQLSLIDAPKEKIYDTITEFASKAIGAPVSLMSMVANDYQFFKSEVGLPEPYKSRRQTPFSHSFCRHVVANNKPLIVSDARKNDLVKNNLAIRDLDVIGYLGIPLTMHDGKPLGSLCVIDSDVRDWTETEIKIMKELASIVTQEFDARAYVLSNKISKEDLSDLQQRIQKFLAIIDLSDSKAAILEVILHQKQNFSLN
ncbi:MAG: GAF domain-containing protein [Phototrophicaceae bacterium]